jgi:hypothetical protein
MNHKRRLASKQKFSLQAEICACFDELVAQGVIVPTGEMRRDRYGRLLPAYRLADPTVAAPSGDAAPEE